MNRTLKLALGAVLGLGMVTPAFAQNFPDIPDNHWAYDALANLKGKVLYGYPDGLFRPARPMSRAEFAVAINQIYQTMMARFASVDAAIAALEKRPTGGGGGGASQADVDAMKKDIADIKSKMGAAPAGAGDMAAMKKLMQEFEKELAEMGVNMDSMKKDMADMAKRLSAVENMGGNGVKISGDGNFVMIAGYSDSDGPGLTPGQRVGGVGQTLYGNESNLVGMNRDFNVFHDFNVNLSGDAGDGVAWKAMISHNNMFGTNINNSDDDLNFTFGNMSEHNFGEGFDADMSVTMIHELSAKFDTSIGGQGFSAEVGRFRHSGGAFFLQRQDTTEFYSHSTWDDGKYAMDGAKFDFGFGGADLTVFMAQNGGNKPVMGTDSEDGIDIEDNWVNPMRLGDTETLVQNTLGAELGFKLGENGSLKAVYYWMDFNENDDLGDGPMNRQNTFGAEANFKFGSIDFWGAYAQTDFMLNNDSVTDENNTATALWAGWKGGEKWGLGGFWASVEGNFNGYGSWGRLGTEWNPRNVEGFGAEAWFQASDRMKLKFSAEMFEAADETDAGFFGLNLGTGDVNSLSVNLNYDVNDTWDLMVGYENVEWDFGGGDTPEQRWWKVGLSRNLSDRSTFSLMWMQSDVDYKGTGNLNDEAGWDVYKGGFLSSQLSFKF